MAGAVGISAVYFSEPYLFLPAHLHRSRIANVDIVQETPLWRRPFQATHPVHAALNTQGVLSIIANPRYRFWNWTQSADLLATNQKLLTLEMQLRQGNAAVLETLKSELNNRGQGGHLAFRSNLVYLNQLFERGNAPSRFIQLVYRVVNYFRSLFNYQPIGFQHYQLLNIAEWESRLFPAIDLHRALPDPIPTRFNYQIELQGNPVIGGPNDLNVPLLQKLELGQLPYLEFVVDGLHFNLAYDQVAQQFQLSFHGSDADYNRHFECTQGVPSGPLFESLAILSSTLPDAQEAQRIHPLTIQYNYNPLRSCTYSAEPFGVEEMITQLPVEPGRIYRLCNPLIPENSFTLRITPRNAN